MSNVNDVTQWFKDSSTSKKAGEAAMSANEKTFDTAGFSKLRDAEKPRVANGLLKRYRTLEYHGHKDIKLIKLSEPMTRSEATKYVTDNRDMVYELADKHLEEALLERDAAKMARAERRSETSRRAGSVATVHSVDELDQHVTELDHRVDEIEHQVEELVE